MATHVDQNIADGFIPAPRVSPLAIKLARILGEINSVPKSGLNEYHQYHYITSDDLMNAIRAKLAASSIFIFTSVESQSIREIGTGEKKSLLSEVSLKHTFVDGESGDNFSVMSQGQGADVADKGGYKAITGAMKYFVYKCFLIATEEGGDELNKSRRLAESGPETAKPAAARSTATPAGTTPAGKLNWREVSIHFGTTYKGVKLGDMQKDELVNWMAWKPNPRYKKSAADALLEIALAEAKKETGL